MKILKTILKVLGVILLLAIIISLFLPAGVRVERSITVNASPEEVYAHISDLKKWDTWSPWKKRDPNMQNTYEGTDGAVGQKSSWKSEHPRVGNGSMTIVELKPYESVVTELDFGQGGKPKGGFKIEKTDSGSKVTWYMEDDGSQTPFLFKMPAKYFNLLMDGMLGPDFEEGLKGIKAAAEAGAGAAPQLTYTIEEVDLAPMSVIAAPPNKIKAEQISAYLGKYIPKLYAAAKKNGQKPGAAMAIYHSWTGTETEVEAVLPVDKVVMAGSEFPHHPMPEGKGLKVDYYGAYAGSEKAHMEIDAYAKYKKLKLGNPWEVYVTDPMTEKDTAKWLTQIYYPIVK